MSSESVIAANVARVREVIAAACQRSGRSADAVRLVAVTKYVGLTAIRALLTAGVRDLGESRVQQLMPRVDACGSADADLDTPDSAGPPRWHMIGTLQRNKVKYLLPRVRIVHSVDSAKLAEQIDRLADQHDISVDVLAEVNVSGEASKHGAATAETDAMLAAVGGMSRVRLRGLMTMAPFDADPETARPHFARLRELLESAAQRGVVGPGCRELSMGMSNDFHVAVEEGATLVRVGSMLFEGLSEQDAAAD